MTQTPSNEELNQRYLEAIDEINNYAQNFIPLLGINVLSPDVLDNLKQTFQDFHNSILSFLKNSVRSNYGNNFSRNKAPLLFQLDGMLSFIASNHPTTIDIRYEQQFKTKASELIILLIQFSNEMRERDDNWSQNDTWISLQSSLNNFTELLYKINLQRRLHPPTWDRYIWNASRCPALSFASAIIWGNISV